MNFARQRDAVRNWWQIARRSHDFSGRCASLHCRKRQWLSVFASGIVLEGQWFCSTTCLEKELPRYLDQAVARTPRHPPVHRIPLGLILLSRGQITTDQLHNTLQLHQETHRARFGECLQQLGHAREREITSALAAQWACPILASDFDPLPATLGMLPRAMHTQFRLAPVHFTPATRTLYIGFESQVDYSLLSAVSRLLECRTEPCILSTSDWLRTQRTERRPSEIVFTTTGPTQEIAPIITSYLTRFSAPTVTFAILRGCTWFRIRWGPGTTDVLFLVKHASQPFISAEHNALTA